MSRVFDAYARYYDLLYRDKDYVAEAEYVASFIHRHAPHAKRILELGCGTGAHAECLARMGYSVHGIDLSPVMLARAEERKAVLPTEIAARLEFSPGDVRAIRTGERYDAVISLFHVMSYQTSDADLVAAMETAASHLPKGGVFLFDFWYGPAVLAQRPELRVRRLEDELVRVTRIAEPVMHEREQVVDVNYDLFLENKTAKTIEEVREQHRMRYLFIPETQRMLQEAGFRIDNRCRWMGVEEPDENTWAAFVAAVK